MKSEELLPKCGYSADRIYVLGSWIMSKKIKSSTFNALIAFIVILSISTIYFSIDKFKQSQLHKLISDSECSKPDKLCVYIKYKYTFIDTADQEIDTNRIVLSSLSTKTISSLSKRNNR